MLMRRPKLFEHFPAGKSVAGFVIYTPLQAFQTGDQGHWLDVKDRILLVRPGQVVIGNL